MPRTIKKLLIANRGEIAVRVVRTCKKLGISTVVAYTLPDAESVAVKVADFSVCIGDYTQYLSIDALITVAKQTQCDAVHPGTNVFHAFL
jgi:acetyl-CoA carboxylase biotin carboxylase subunit